MTTLFEAITSQSLDEAYRLAQLGIDLNTPGADESTPLHAAVRIQNAHLAATLLSNGADFTIPNKEGKTALDLSFTDLSTLHRIRQEYQRLRSPEYAAELPQEPVIAATVEQLRSVGLTKISGLVSPGDLQQMQSDFSDWARKIELEKQSGKARFTHYDQEEYWHEEHESYVTNDALKHSPTFARLCCHPNLAAVANWYLGGDAHLKRAYFMRYRPKEELNQNQFCWHHDMEDRQMKAFILLSDIGEDDQYMSHVRGSHNAFHPYERFLKNAIDFDYCSQYLEKMDLIKTIGMAGDIFLFDSNGMHRGNRSLGRSRDVLFAEYTMDGNQGNIWGSSAKSLPVDDLPDGERLIAPFLAITPKWERHQQETEIKQTWTKRLHPRFLTKVSKHRGQKIRKRPTWAESLEDPSVWLGNTQSRNRIMVARRKPGNSI